MAAIDDFAKDSAKQQESASIVDFKNHRSLQETDDLYAMSGSSSSSESIYGEPQHDLDRQADNYNLPASDGEIWQQEPPAHGYSQNDFLQPEHMSPGDIGGPRVAPTSVNTGGQADDKKARLKKVLIMTVPAVAIIGFSGFNIYRQYMTPAPGPAPMPTIAVNDIKPLPAPPPPIVASQETTMAVPAAVPSTALTDQGDRAPVPAIQQSNFAAAVPAPAAPIAEQTAPVPTSPATAAAPLPTTAQNAAQPMAATMPAQTQSPAVIAALPSSMNPATESNTDMDGRIAKMEANFKMLDDRTSNIMDKIASVEKSIAAISSSLKASIKNQSSQQTAAQPKPKPITTVEKKPDTKGTTSTKPVETSQAPAKSAPQQIQPMKAAAVVSAAQAGGEPATAKNLPTSAVPALKVYAMKDGVAWLADPNGQRTMVAIGDSVTGRGTVKGIDVERGEVRMSDGSVIR